MNEVFAKHVVQFWVNIAKIHKRTTVNHFQNEVKKKVTIYRIFKGYEMIKTVKLKSQKSCTSSKCTLEIVRKI